MSEYVLQNRTVPAKDLRDLLGLSPNAFSEFISRSDIEYEPLEYPRQRARYLSHDSARTLVQSSKNKWLLGDKTKIVSVAMCKGGVGKSTTAFYLSQRLHAFGARVLVIDTDSQGNLSAAFPLEGTPYELDDETAILLDVVSNKTPIQDALIPLAPGFDLLPSTPLNSRLEKRITDNSHNPSRVLNALLAPVLNQYDFIILDTAPSFNMTNTCVLTGSDHVIMPVVGDKFSYMGLGQTIEEIELLEHDFGINVKKHILFSKYDEREKSSFIYIGQIVEKFDNMLLPFTVRTCADVKNAIMSGDNLFAIKKSSARADFTELANFFIAAN